MRVKVRAVILRDGKLVVSRERRRGIEHILLPGGRVQEAESVINAVSREVAEETGLDVVPKRLLYVAEVAGSYGAHDLILVWLAEPRDPDLPIDDDMLVTLDSSVARAMMPPLIEQIAADAANGWPPAPRWLGNIRRHTAEPAAARVGAAPGVVSP